MIKEATMGVRGPVPKRTSELRRRNIKNVDTVELDEVVEVPPLLIEDAPQLVHDLYNSLARSGQARYYEPSDWERARIACYMLTRMMKNGRPSAQLYLAVQKDFDSLLIGEAERRRAHMEIERTNVDTSEEEARVAQMQRYRRAAGGSE